MSMENINSFESYQYRQGVMVSSSFLIANSGAFIISLSPNAILVSSFFITLKVITVLKNFCQVPVMCKIPTIAKLRATNQKHRLGSLGTTMYFIKQRKYKAAFSRNLSKLLSSVRTFRAIGRVC